MANTDYSYIVTDDDICFGKPRIKGTRISVKDIVIEFDRMGKTGDEIIDAHPELTLAQVYSAIAYYFDHLEEIDMAIQKSLKKSKEYEKMFPSRIKR